MKLQDIAPLPDFKLVSKSDESEFCRWESVRDYSPEVDRVTEPRYFTMPPLLRLLMERNLKERNETPGEESFLLPHYKTYTPKNFEMFDCAEVWNKQLPEEFQETMTVCEGTASHNYADKIDQEFRVEEPVSILDQLPEEAPMPAPALGMRLYHRPDTSRRHKEEIRTEEHNTFFP